MALAPLQIILAISELENKSAEADALRGAETLVYLLIQHVDLPAADAR